MHLFKSNVLVTYKWNLVNLNKANQLDQPTVAKSIFAETDAIHKNYKKQLTKGKITLPIVQMLHLIDWYEQLDLCKALNWSGNPAV